MSFLDFVRPVSSWSVQQLKDFLHDHHPDSLILLDVRHPEEFTAGHLPGAINIPLAALHERLADLDRRLPLIVYCSNGVRSRAAAGVLGHAGFDEVHNLSGGLHAWEGALAEGLPADELARFERFTRPAEHAALAWCLEEGTRSFYAEVAELVRDVELAALFRDLVAAEEQHKATLLEVYEALHGAPAPADFPQCVIGEVAEEGYMEGGMTVVEVFDGARRRPTGGILELAMAVETNAFDRYLHLSHELPDENSRRVFELLADEERRHLKRLGATLDHFV
jgi:sulfur-carrier protein adenylyltransferase/sulfurtransferase